MIKVVIRVLRFVLHNLDIYLANPKLPLESVSSLINPPKSRHTSITHTLSASIFCSASVHPLKNPLPNANTDASIEPTIMHARHCFVITAPIMIITVMITATRPRFISICQSPLLCNKKETHLQKSTANVPHRTSYLLELRAIIIPYLLIDKYYFYSFYTCFQVFTVLSYFCYQINSGGYLYGKKPVPYD